MRSIRNALGRMNVNRNSQNHQANHDQRRGVMAPNPEPGMVRSSGIANGRVSRQLQSGNNRNRATSEHDGLYVAVRDVTMRNEPKAAYCTIPGGRSIQELMNQTHISHPSTDRLQGRDFLMAIQQDNRLGLDFRDYINSPHVLQSSTLFSLANCGQLNDLVKKLRLIAAVARGNIKLCNTLDAIARNAIDLCVDRSNYSLNTMWGEALQESLRQVAQNNNSQLNHESEINLFNLGVAFYRLKVLRSTIDGLPWADHGQSVHTYQALERALAQRLNLPVDHSENTVHLNNDRLNNRKVQEVAELVENKINPWDVYLFMTDWQPWKQHIVNLPRFADQRNQIAETRDKNFEQFEIERADPNSNAGRLSETEYVEKSRQIGNRLDEWERLIVRESTERILLEHRTCFLLEQGVLPSFLRRN